jgi:hypothetical protein
MPKGLRPHNSSRQNHSAIMSLNGTYAPRTDVHVPPLFYFVRSTFGGFQAALMTSCFGQ